MSRLLNLPMLPLDIQQNYVDIHPLHSNVSIPLGYLRDLADQSADQSADQLTDDCTDR